MCTNASYWSDLNWIIILSVNKKVVGISMFTTLSMVYSGYVGEYKCSVIGPCLLLCPWFLCRLRRRAQVYCNRSMFTTLSMALTIQIIYIGTTFIYDVELEANFNSVWVGSAVSKTAVLKKCSIKNRSTPKTQSQKPQYTKTAVS